MGQVSLVKRASRANWAGLPCINRPCKYFISDLEVSLRFLSITEFRACYSKVTDVIIH